MTNEDDARWASHKVRLLIAKLAMLTACGVWL